MSSHALGVDAYADPDSNNGELLKNLEGCNVHRFTPGTEEHAGTALMVVELPTNEGLGVQIEMDTDAGEIPTYECTRSSDGQWSANRTADYRDRGTIEEACPDLEILEVVYHNIMDPDTARVVVILGSDDVSPFGVDIHLHEDGGTDFFEVSI